MRNTASWVWGSLDPTEYKAAARSFVPPRELPSFRHPDTPKRAVVLEAVKAKACGGPPKAAQP